MGSLNKRRTKKNKKTKRTQDQGGKPLYIKEGCPWFDCEFFHNLYTTVVRNEHPTKTFTEKIAAIIIEKFRDFTLLYGYFDIYTLSNVKTAVCQCFS